jgi:pyrophosphatase PpaX
MTVTTVLFDLDGTLLDSYNLIATAFRHTCRVGLGRELTDQEVTARWGEHLLARLAHVAPGSGPDQIEALAETYSSYYMAHHDELASLFPGIPKMLDALTRRGCRMGIVTSKWRLPTLQTLRVFDLARFIEVAVCADDVGARKPAPDPILEALRQLAGRPDGALMVGDGVFDIQAARAARVRSVAALWGSREVDALMAAGADYAVASPEGMVALVESG